ncbi:hypothetical protein ACFMQL_17245 [Nonomuraea fastidiosa]|uniref:hypothetical protein n=1 Tax=Nonomuraea fastidiosa TaxID=46173 RepID=UPI00366F6961
MKPDHAEQFDRLLAAAATVRITGFDHAGEAAYEAANSSVDEMAAVWDGKPGTGRGGTAEVVAEARKRGMKVTVIWPEDAAREERP